MNMWLRVFLKLWKNKKVRNFIYTENFKIIKFWEKKIFYSDISNLESTITKIILFLFLVYSELSIKVSLVSFSIYFHAIVYIKTLILNEKCQTDLKRYFNLNIY